MIFSSKFISAVAAVLASSIAVHAQTFTDCNPMQRDDCPIRPALGKTVSIDFTKGKDTSFFNPLEASNIQYGSEGAIFSIGKVEEAPTIASNKWIFFGRVEVVLRAAPGAGIVTSVVLQSDDLDEIDWEWIGNDPNRVQTNYFSKGDTSTYDRGAFHPAAGAIDGFHTYIIDWTPERIEWSVNGNVVRTLTYNDAKGGSTYPQTPMQVKLGTWVAGKPGASQGTIEWAGGIADFSKGPFLGYYKSITVTDYSEGAGRYKYGDRTGTFGSIEILPADGSNTNTRTSTTTTKATTTTKTTTNTTPTSMSTTTRPNSTSSGVTAPGPVSTSEPTNTPQDPNTPSDGEDDNPNTIPAAAPRTALTTVTMVVALACVCLAQLLV